MRIFEFIFIIVLLSIPSNAADWQMSFPLHGIPEGNSSIDFAIDAGFNSIMWGPKPGDAGSTTDGVINRIRSRTIPDTYRNVYAYAHANGMTAYNLYDLKYVFPNDNDLHCMITFTSCYDPKYKSQIMTDLVWILDGSGTGVNYTGGYGTLGLIDGIEFEEPSFGQGKAGYAEVDAFFYEVSQLVKTRIAKGTLDPDFKIAINTAATGPAGFEEGSNNMTYIDGANPSGEPLFDYIRPQLWSNDPGVLPEAFDNWAHWTPNTPIEPFIYVWEAAIRESGTPCNNFQPPTSRPACWNQEFFNELRWVVNTSHGIGIFEDIVIQSGSLELDFPTEYNKRPAGVYNPIQLTTYIIAHANAISDPATSVPATIVTHPSNGLNYVGGTIYFYVTATGSTPLYYQWQKNGTNISGASSSSYTTPTLTANDNHSLFRVLVWNGNGIIYSNYATVTVLPPVAPIITIQPSNITVFVGYSATFSVVASGTSPLTYQWQKNGANIPGAMNASYATPLTTMLDNGSTYRVNVTNPEGSVTSNAATLTVQTNTNNFINNTGFESGTTSWTFYSGGTGTFSLSSPGYEGNNAAKLAFSNGGTNIQLYQDGRTLEPNTGYRLSFSAYSNTGHDLMVNLMGIPYSDYGLSQTFDLGTNWQTYTTEFTTTGFTGTVSNGRLQFWIAPFAEAGDTYYIDNVRLEMLVNGSNSIYDLNNDSVVDTIDLSTISLHYNEITTFPYPNYDINNDGKVDILDLVLVAINM